MSVFNNGINLILVNNNLSKNMGLRHFHNEKILTNKPHVYLGHNKITNTIGKIDKDEVLTVT